MPFKPPVLSDPVVGNIGLYPDDAMVVLRCDEPAGVMLSDKTGNLLDLAPDAGTNSPTTVQCWTGPGRRFVAASSQALITSDAPNGNTLSIREVTVQAIIAITLPGGGGAMTLVQRGDHDGTAGEKIAYGIEIQEDGINPGWVNIRMFWEDSAGTIQASDDGTYLHPGDGKFILLTVTRRWESSTLVVNRYYVGDQLIGEVSSMAGSIAGGTTGHMMVGGRKSGGAWTRFLNGTIDELKIVPYEMSGDEVRETWRRLTVHQPAGVAMFSGLAPPGAPWTKDPADYIGRLVKLVGQSLGTVIAKAEEVRATWLPDGIALRVIGRWEKICGLAPRPRDSLDARRSRVVAYLSRLQGYSIAALKQALSGVLRLAASDVQILEFTNTITDGFATLAAERWLTGNTGAWTIAAGELKLIAAIASDLRWDPTRANCHVRMPLGQTGGAFVAQVKLSTYWANLPANTVVGLFLYNRVSNNSIWFGVKNVGGVRKVGYTINVGNVVGAFVTLLTPSLDQAYWLRVSPKVGGLGNTSTFSFSYSTTGPTTGFVSVDVTTGVHDIEWAGVAAMSTDASLAAGLQATFDDFEIVAYKSLRPFYWYVYRDPGLAGSPDVPAAQILSQKMKPAHTYSAVTQSKSVLCDDARDGLCDRGPLGGL